MSITAPSISFGRNAILINDDIATVAVISGGTQSFSDITDLQKVVAAQNRFITYEQDFWLLDGSYKFVPSNPDVGYMSTAMSDSGSTFAATVPLVKFTFNAAYSTTNGLTIYFSEFSGDWCDSITVAFYNASNSLIRTDNYTPTSAIFHTNQAVSNFKRVDISFNSSNKPYRYVRLGCVNFDNLITFTGTDIKSAKLIEQINVLSLELPMNSIEFTLHSDDVNFNIVDPVGFYATLRDGEPLEAYEIINNALTYLGRFYLDKWESISDNDASFHAYDIIHQLENIQYDGDIFHPTLSLTTHKKASVVISDLSTAGGFSYTLDSALNASSFDTHGWMPITDIRKDLQALCFAIGGYTTCSRSKSIQIRKAELASALSVYDYTLTNADIGINPNVSLLPLVTGVEITSHDYSSGHAGTTGNSDLDYDNHLFAQDVALGAIKIVSDKPINLYDFTGAGTGDPTTALFTQIGHNCNYFSFNITTAGHLRLDGEMFVDGKKLKTQYTGGLPAGTIPNVIKITDATLVATYNVATVLSLVYDYYQQRYKQKIKLFASAVAVGDSMLVPTQAGQQFKGIIERMETDLANGFVSTVELVGVIV
jgi:hypothetical protein